MVFFSDGKTPQRIRYDNNLIYNYEKLKVGTDSKITSYDKDMKIYIKVDDNGNKIQLEFK